jgi:hypothetical protein
MLSSFTYAMLAIAKSIDHIYHSCIKRHYAKLIVLMATIELQTPLFIMSGKSCR